MFTAEKMVLLHKICLCRIMRLLLPHNSLNRKAPFVHARAQNIFQKAGAVFRSYDGSYWFCLLCPKLGDNVLVEKFKEQCFIMVSIPVGYYWVLLLFFIEIL